MREEEPLVVIIDDGRVSRVAVASYLADDALCRPLAHDVVRHGVGNLLWPTRCIAQIILAIVLMHPRSLGKRELSTYVNALDVAIYLHHVVLQLGDVALLVAPYNIRCIVIVDEDGWVDASPTVLGIEAILVGKQWFAQGILVRTRNLIAHRHADATPVGRDIPIILAVAFHHMTSVCLLALRPLEVGDHQWRRILRPMLQVGSREYLPVVHLITRMIALGIMPCE